MYGSSICTDLGYSITAEDSRTANVTGTAGGGLLYRRRDGCKAIVSVSAGLTGSAKTVCWPGDIAAIASSIPTERSTPVWSAVCLWRHARLGRQNTAPRTTRAPERGATRTSGERIRRHAQLGRQSVAPRAHLGLLKMAPRMTKATERGATYNLGDSTWRHALRRQNMVPGTT